MAKKSNRQRKPTPLSAKSNTKPIRFTEEDIDDEIDAFHKQRDVIPLDVDEDEVAAETDDETEHAVFDLEDGEESSDNAGSEDEDDSLPRGFAAKIARQAKYLKQKFGSFDDEMNDDVSEEDQRKKAWGRKKDPYYDADNVDYELQESDEELPMEEETEAVKLQKDRAASFGMEDLGLEDPDEVDSDSDEDEKRFSDTFAGKKTVSETNVNSPPEDVPFENFGNVNKDIKPLSKEKQMEVVYSSAPELVTLLAEMDKALNQLKEIKPLLPGFVKEREDKTKGTLSYLKVQHILLLTYCQAINFYLLLKSEGHSILGHPVISRLVQIKTMLEKLEKIDPNLPSHVEDVANFEANLETDTGVKLAQDCLPFDSETNLIHSSARSHEVNEPSKLLKGKQSKDLINKNVNTDLQDAQIGLQSMAMLKVRANLEAKLKEKGIYNSSKSNPARTQKQDPKLANRRLETPDDFDDEVQQTAKRSRDSNGNISMLQLSKQEVVAVKGKKQKVISGDDDLPKRDDIGQRRRKFELRVLARTGTKSADDGGDDDVEDEEDDPRGAKVTDGLMEEEEVLGSGDELHHYHQVEKQRANKVMAKKQLYSRTPSTPVQPEEIDEDGKRHITYQMEKNRGLTRPRKKLLKNPRKKYRTKHQKAVVRRKGQVRDIKKPSGPYGGESTGINIGVSRSIRFNR